MSNQENYAKILSGAAQGASHAMEGTSKYASTKIEAKEAKRRTLANLMNNAMKRNKDLFKAGQEDSDDSADFQSKSMQRVARGFVDALHGSKGRR